MIRAASIALAALILLGAAAAPLQQGVGWQGLAYRNDGRFHILSVDDAPSEAAARAELRRECARRGFSCDIVAVVTDCLATAYSEANLSFFTAAGPTRQSAVNAAYGVCASNGGPCDKDMAVCPTPASRPPTRTAAPRPAPAVAGPINPFAAASVLADRGTPQQREGGDARGRMWRTFTAAPGQPASRITLDDCQHLDCRTAIFSQERAIESGRALTAADLAIWNDRGGPVRLRLRDGPDARGLVAEMTWRAGGTGTFAQAVETWAKASAEAGLWLDGMTGAGPGSGW